MRRLDDVVVDADDLRQLHRSAPSAGLGGAFPDVSVRSPKRPGHVAGPMSASRRPGLRSARRLAGRGSRPSPDRNGVLPCQYLERAIAARVIDAGRFTIPEENVQPASLDLRLGEVAYRIRCSFLPGRQSVERRVKDYVIDELDLRKDGVVLETKRPYLIPLKERLSLPPTVRGQGQPEELDRPHRRVHPRDHRRELPLRRDRGRLRRAALPRGGAALVPGARARGPLAEPAAAVGRFGACSATTRCARSTTGEPLLFDHGTPVPSDQARVRRRAVPRPRPPRRRRGLRRPSRARQRAAARRRARARRTRRPGSRSGSR